MELIVNGKTMNMDELGSECNLQKIDIMKLLKQGTSAQEIYNRFH